MGVSVGAAVLAILFAYNLFISKNTVPAADKDVTGFAKLIQNKYYVDEAYEAVFVNPMRKLSDVLYSFGEFLIDLVVNGSGRLVQFSAGRLRLLQSGETGFYVFAMVIGILAVLAWNFFLK
jgi:NADH-quinone oxidoreductase subunit L